MRKKGKSSLTAFLRKKGKSSLTAFLRKKGNFSLTAFLRKKGNFSLTAFLRKKGKNPLTAIWRKISPLKGGLKSPLLGVGDFRRAEIENVKIEPIVQENNDGTKNNGGRCNFS